MNKKTVTMITSLVVGGTLLAGTAFASASQLSGYETYKAALKDTKNLKNGTAALKLSVTDNGSSLIDVNSNVKLNLGANAMSSITTLKTGTASETFSNYVQDGKNISKNSNSNEYTVFENKHNKLDKLNKNVNPQIEKSVEVVIDTLTGSMKDGVSAADNGNGTKKVNIALNENQVTPLVNAVTSMALIGENEVSKHNEKADLKDIKNSLPQLQSDIKVESVNSTANIDKNDVITGQEAKIVLSGKDAQGKVHEIVINASMDLSNINSTKPDKVDLTGKQVKTITSKFEEGHRK